MGDALGLQAVEDGLEAELEAVLGGRGVVGGGQGAAPDLPPAAMGLLPGDTDGYIITEGGMKGLRGFFTRDQRGAVVGVDLAGRLFNRVPAAPQ